MVLAAVLTLVGCAEQGASGEVSPVRSPSQGSASGGSTPTGTEDPVPSPVEVTGSKEPVVAAMLFDPLVDCPDLGSLGLERGHFPDMTCGYFNDVDYQLGLTQASEPVEFFRGRSEDDLATLDLILEDHTEFGEGAYSSVAAEGASPGLLDEMGCVYYVPTTDGGTLVFWGMGYEIAADVICSQTHEAVRDVGRA